MCGEAVKRAVGPLSSGRLAPERGAGEALRDLNEQGIDLASAQRALGAMVRQREFEEVAQGKKVKRLR